MQRFGILTGIIVFFLFLGSVNAYSLSAWTDKLVYKLGENLRVTGTIDYQNEINITLTLWNATPIVLINTSYNGSFQFSYPLDNLSLGKYNITVSDGVDSVMLEFTLVGERVYLEIFLINGSIVPVETNVSINISDYNGGNFTELLNLSLSHTLRYGNTSEINPSKTHHIVLVDENIQGVYDILYIDDDNRFELFNDIEDTGSENEVEAVGEAGETKKDYLISYIDPQGRGTILVKPISSSKYSPGQIVKFMVISRYENGSLLGNQGISIKLLDSNGTVINSSYGMTNEIGYWVSQFTVPSRTGVYTLDVNNSLGIEFFRVEAFKLFGSITDLSDSPMMVFGPNPSVRIKAVAKDMNENPINLSSVYARITYPNGTIMTVSLDYDSPGIYKKDIDFFKAPLGTYGVKIIGIYSGNQQEILTSFSIESLNFGLQPININFIEEADSPEVMVNAFAPGSNVTIVTFLSNLSAGGMMGPEGMGMIDIDNVSTTNDECESRLMVLELKDDDGSVYTPEYHIMNLSRAMEYLGMQPEEGPPPNMMRQCMIVFEAPNKTGTYHIRIKLTYKGEEKTSGAVFGVQKVYASGSTVDFKGEEFSFFAPNTTVRIKLKVKDLQTREEVPSENILGAKILEMKRVFPSPMDVFTPEYRVIANESISNGTLTFQAPDLEGAFILRFKFRVNLSDEVIEGIGNAFFMLKKYIIWAEPECGNGFGNCVFGTGENITLTVHVVDVDKGNLLDMGISSGLTCTGCEGLVADVELLRNDQVMKIIPKTQYSVIKGAVTNSTANLTIVPGSSFPTGWYGIDIKVYNPLNENETYFGWGWFEVRNFMVEFLKVSNGTATWGWNPTYGIGMPVTFAVLPRDPKNWEILNATEPPSLESLRLMDTWPPVEKEVNYEVTLQAINISFCEGENCPPPETLQLYVINITDLDTSGVYQANVKVTISKGSDIGSFWFDMSSYRVLISYRGMEEWPAKFQSNENLTINLTGCEISEEGCIPHNLSQEGTKLRFMFDEVAKKPIKVNSTTTCSENLCTITVNLSGLVSGRRYGAEIIVNDTQGVRKNLGGEVFIQIQNFVLAVPVIEELFVDYRDSKEKEFLLENDRDLCDNQKTLENYNVSSGYWFDMFCIRENGEWKKDGCWNEPGLEVNVTSNGTSLFIDVKNEWYSPGDTFELNGKNWTLVSVENENFQVNNTDGICGEYWNEFGHGTYVITPPGNYSDFYHTWVGSLIAPHVSFLGEPFNQSRPLYLYHNTTHLWITNSTNLSQAEPRTVNEIITDPYGGEWKIKYLNKNKVILEGVNVLADTGAFINTSLSQSGVIKIGRIEESWLGGWDRTSQNIRGLDIDGDGYTNGTFYLAISDSQVSGIYDTLFFSPYKDICNFNFSYNINAPRTSRIFGLNDTLTLLSIDPDANRVRVYSNRYASDWTNLGNIKYDSDVRIPVMVKSPNGSFTDANVSIEGAKIKTIFSHSDVSFSPAPNATISGIGEIVLVNVSSYGFGTGEYMFRIKAERNGAEEVLEEWRWPHADVRMFLVYTEIGVGGFISGFKDVPLFRYDWETYGEVKERLFNITFQGQEYKSVFLFEGNDSVMEDTSSCVAPPGAGDDPDNVTIMSKELKNPQYYFYLTPANKSLIWVKTGDCNFSTGANSYNVTANDPITILKSTPQGDRKFFLNFLNASGNRSSESWVIIGINSSEFDSAKLDPVGEHEGSVYWGMMYINVSGKEYNVLLGGASVKYPTCEIWNIQECSKRAWFSDDGNFSKSTPVFIGENFDGDLYLAKVGPGLWDGLIIGNYSEIQTLPSMPGIDAIVFDETPCKFAYVQESNIRLDLNRDGAETSNFYVVLYDDNEDGIQNVTRIKTDDDLNITERWWSEESGESTYYKDFYTNETGMSEQEGNLPKGIWEGTVRFGESNESLPWEKNPEWRIKNFNGSEMLIMKHLWEVNVSQNITLLVKAYNFDHTPIQGAEITLDSMVRMTSLGPVTLNESHYQIINIRNVTDSSGYGMIRISPISQWDEGDYIIILGIKSQGITETVKHWFRVGEGW